MSNPYDIERLRAKIRRLQQNSLTNNALDNISASFEQKLEAINEGVGALAGSVLNVSSSLSVSIEQAASALQAGLEANAGALLNVSSSLSVSLDTAKSALQASLEANAGALLILSSSTSSSLSQSATALQQGLVALGGSILELSSSTSSSLSQSADAIKKGLTALGGTILDVSSSLSTSSEVARQLLQESLTNLVNQNSSSFRTRVDGLDGKVDGALEDVVILSGSYGDYTASINSYTNSVNQHTAATNNYNSEFSRKTKAFSENSGDETTYRTSIYSGISEYNLLKSFSYASQFLNNRNVSYPTPSSYWAYTVSYPTGTNPFKINSYSYMGSSAGKKYWNLEEVMSYSKREYSIDESSAGGYDANNTMVKTNGEATVINNSILSLKADQIQIEKGRTNITDATLVIIGETSETDGYSYNQGQLFIKDEDASTSGLQIGYRWQSGIAEYGRIQTINSVGPTELRINPAGGKVSIKRLQNHLVEDGSIELSYYNSGDRPTYIDYHSAYTENQTDYEARNIRWGGVDGIFEIINTGDGGIRNTVTDTTGGNLFDWYVNGARKMLLNSSGDLIVAGSIRSSEINIEADRIELKARDSDSADLAINYLGYNGGTTRFRNVRIYNGKQGQIALFEGSSGKAYKSGGGFWDTLSDIRVKENIREYKKGLNYIKQINPVIFDYNGKASLPKSKDNISIIAQDILEKIPETISIYKSKLNDNDTEDVDLYTFNPNPIFYMLINSVKELSAENDYLKNKLEEKDKQIQDILLRLSALEKNNG